MEYTAQDPEGEHLIPKQGDKWWELNTDGLASSRHCGGGIMLTFLEGFKLYYALVYQFWTLKNVAEYKAVFGGLWLAIDLKVTRVRIRSNTKLVAGQLGGTFEAKEENIKL